MMRPPIRLTVCAAALAGLLGSGCAAVPVAVAVGAMGAVPGDRNADAGADAPQPAPAQPASDQPVPAQILPPRADPPRDFPALPLARPALLPPQDLAAGDCALFLFSSGADSEFRAFAPADGGSLKLNLDGVRTLPAIAPLAESSEMFEQTYESGGLTARLSAALGEVLPQGRRVPEATLRLSGAEGAALVTPLAGLLACAAETEAQ